MADTTAARNAVAKRPETQAPTIFGLIERQQSQVARAIGSTVGAERFVRNMLTTIRMTPKLAQCTPESLLGAMMQSAQLRLDPGPLQLVHFIPYQNRGRLECQFQLGYRAYLELAFRAGIVVTAHEVAERDEFSVEWGSEEKVIHRPALSGDRGPVIGYYAVARRDGETVASKYMTAEEVQAHRRQYARAGKDSPWETAFGEMALKTVIRLLAKRLPLSVVGEEVAQAVQIDTAVLHHEEDGFLTVEHVEVDEETGEITEPVGETLV